MNATQAKALSTKALTQEPETKLLSLNQLIEAAAQLGRRKIESANIPGEDPIWNELVEKGFEVEHISMGGILTQPPNKPDPRTYMSTVISW